MINKIARRVITVLFLTAAAVIFVLFTNFEYFTLGKEAQADISKEKIEFVNWERSDGQYVSGEDPQIILNGLNAYVEYVDLHCSLSYYDTQVQIFYTSVQNELFTEEKSILTELSPAGNTLRFPVNNDVYSLRIDLTNSVDVSMTFTGASMSPTPFSIDILTLAVVLFMVCIILIPLYYPLSQWGNLKVYGDSFKRYRYLLFNLVKKDFTTKYRRSVLGVLWSVLNPLLMMLVITLVFQHIFKSTIENFPLYYLTGSLIFNFVTEATSSSMTSVLGASPLIKKVYIPKYIFPLEKCIFALVNMLFSMFAVVIMFVFLRVEPSWSILLFPIPMFYALVFSIGFGMILASIDVFFRDMGHLYGVWTTAWVYLTPIIYPMDILPPAMVTVVKLNPLYYYVEYFREIMLYGNIPGVRMNVTCMLFSGVFLLLGVVIFKKKQDRFILYM